jgi:hypothetical protein
MKKALQLIFLLMFGGSILSKAQTNTFPTTGNVGIGTLSPDSKLHTVGDLHTSGTLGGNGMFWNVLKIFPLQYSPLYFYINTNIPANDSMAPQLRITGYTYGGAPTSNKAMAVTLGWYHYAGNFYWSQFHSDFGYNKPSRIRLGTYMKNGAAFVRIEIANDGIYWANYSISAMDVFDDRFVCYTGWSYEEGEMPTGTTSQITNVNQVSSVSVDANLGIGMTTPFEKLAVNGNIGIKGNGANRYIITDEPHTGTTKLTMQAGAGSSGFGGAINLYGHAHANRPGSVIIGISAAAGATGTAQEGRFVINDQALGEGTDLFTVKRTGNVGIGTNSPTAKLHVTSGTDDAIFINGTYNKFKTAAGVNLLESYHGTEIVLDMLGNYNDRTFKISKGASIIAGGVPTELFRVEENGKVGIGTATPDEKLTVNGKIHAKEIKVDGAMAPDYVFEADYKLLSLNDIEAFIKKNKHLPEVPSAAETEKNGLELGEMNRLLLKKIEELTLYMIELKKENNQLKSTVNKAKELEERLARLERLIN